MKEERRRILEMLAEGKITTDEAEELLAALNLDTKGKKSSLGKRIKTLEIKLWEGEGDKLEVNIPDVVKGSINKVKQVIQERSKPKDERSDDNE